MPKALSILEFHRFCLADLATAHYRQAILQSVRPGDVVVDIGAGAGSLSFFACQAGAAKVYAVELDDSLELGRILAHQNGYADRIVFLKADAKKVQLPERADLLVTNTLETLGLNGGLLDLVIDARERFLKPGATIIPRRLGLHLAPAELPEHHERHVGYWSTGAHGLDLASLHQFAVNNIYALRTGREAFLAPAAQVADIDLAMALRLDVRGEAVFTAQREGVMHGLVGWFDTSLTSEIHLSNEPETDLTGYNHAFLPLARPVAVKPGDTIHIVLSTYNGAQWRWQVACEHQAQPADGQAEAVERFDHSTFWGFPLTKSQVQELGEPRPA